LWIAGSGWLTVIGSFGQPYGGRGPVRHTVPLTEPDIPPLEQCCRRYDEYNREKQFVILPAVWRPDGQPSVYIAAHKYVLY